MFWYFKENKKLKERIKLLEEEIENLKEHFINVLWVSYYEKPCKFCGWEVVYTWYEAHWIADIKCVKCWAKWFVYLNNNH